MSSAYDAASTAEENAGDTGANSPPADPTTSWWDELVPVATWPVALGEWIGESIVGSTPGVDASAPADPSALPGPMGKLQNAVNQQEQHLDQLFADLGIVAKWAAIGAIVLFLGYVVVVYAPRPRS